MEANELILDVVEPVYVYHTTSQKNVYAIRETFAAPHESVSVITSTGMCAERVPRRFIPTTSSSPPNEHLTYANA